jgi:type IV secretory pathway VirB4 component
MAQKTKEALSSQSLISLSQIKNGVIILKNGALRSVLEVSGINLSLKSEDEQNAILTSWRNLLNNLEFSLEIVIHSRHLNIDPYLNFLEERVSQEQTELLKLQGEDYYSFIKGLVTENNIMRKKFYLVVPYDPVVIRPKTALGQIAGSFKSMLNLSRKSFNVLNPLSNEEFNQYYQQLMIRQDNIIANLYHLGLSARPLETKELIEILFNLYNPETFEKESLSLPEKFNT